MGSPDIAAYGRDDAALAQLQELNGVIGNRANYQHFAARPNLGSRTA
jgi:hypothetical protein